jgi:excisionase family DNA binding protein
LFAEGMLQSSKSKKEHTNMDAIEKVPIHNKLALTIREAAEYSNIGINKIDSMLRRPNCPFVLYVGAKKRVKRKEFEQYISQQLMI